MGIREGIVDTTEKLLINAMESFDKMAHDSLTVLTGGVDGVWSSAVGISNNFIPFCNVIVGICMLLEIAKVASKVDMVKWEQALRVGVKMCLAKVCIDISPTFLRACYNQSVLFIGDISAPTATTLSSTVTPLISTACGEVDSLGEAIGLLCSTLLLQLGIKICGLMIIVMAYGRVFEILMYVIVSPVPVAFACYNEGGDGLSRITTKFIKGFIAVCLSGVMMYACLSLFSAIISTSFTTMVTATSGSGATGASLISDLCYDMLLFTIVLLMAITKCGSWAKQLMDA